MASLRKSRNLRKRLGKTLRKKSKMSKKTLKKMKPRKSRNLRKSRKLGKKSRVKKGGTNMFRTWNNKYEENKQLIDEYFPLEDDAKFNILYKKFVDYDNEKNKILFNIWLKTKDKEWITNSKLTDADMTAKVNKVLEENTTYREHAKHALRLAAEMMTMADAEARAARAMAAVRAVAQEEARTEARARAVRGLQDAELRSPHSAFDNLNKLEARIKLSNAQHRNDMATRAREPEPHTPNTVVYEL